MNDVDRILTGEPESRLEAILATTRQPSASSAVADAIVTCLADDHPGLRQAALEAVGHLAHVGTSFDASVLERAVELTRDDSPKVRAEAAASLALIETDVDFGPRQYALRRLLGDDDESVRQEAAAALGDLRDRASIEKLAETLEDRDPGVVFEAAFALAAMRDARARPALEAALRRPQKRLDAMKGLGLLADAAAVPALERYTGRLFIGWADRLTAHATLYLLGESASAQAILGRTTARNFQERTYALALIGSHRVREGGDVLVRIAEDRSDRMRDTAVRALGALGGTNAVYCLERLATNDAEPIDLRRDAADALRESPGAEAERALAMLASDDTLARRTEP